MENTLHTIMSLVVIVPSHEQCGLATQALILLGLLHVGLMKRYLTSLSLSLLIHKTGIILRLLLQYFCATSDECKPLHVILDTEQI